MPTRWDVGDTPQHSDAAAAACLWDRGVLADLRDPDVIREIVTVFAQQVREGLPRLREAIDRGDDARAHEIAHRLKGSAATVGAERIAALCDAVCRAAAGGLTEVASALHRELTEAWGETAEAIASELERT